MAAVASAQVDAEAALRYLVAKGFTEAEAKAVEMTNRRMFAVEGGDTTFNVRLLTGLGRQGLSELRTALRGPEAPKVPMSELKCVFTGIGKGNHRSDKNPVQRLPFSRAGKWVEIWRGFPMCERCTSTLRKHYTGATYSPDLAAAFVHTVKRYKCRDCDAWVEDTSLAKQHKNLVCEQCGWTGGSRKRPDGPLVRAKLPQPKVEPGGAAAAVAALPAELVKAIEAAHSSHGGGVGVGGTGPAASGGVDAVAAAAAAAAAAAELERLGSAGPKLDSWLRDAVAKREAARLKVTASCLAASRSHITSPPHTGPACGSAWLLNVCGVSGGPVLVGWLVPLAEVS
jgi:hypothetical protein